MGFANHLIRYLVTLLLMAGVGLAIAYGLLPEGSSLTNLPKTMALVRSRTPNPTAQKILEMIMTEEMAKAVAEEEAQLARVENLDVATTTIRPDLGVPDGTVIDPRALEAIDKMSVSLELKREIKRHYMQTGELGGVRLAPEPVEAAENAETNPEADESERSIASVFSDPLTVWPTRSLAAAAAVTAGAATSAPRPKLADPKLESQAETLHAKILSASTGPVGDRGSIESRSLATAANDILKALKYKGE